MEPIKSRDNQHVKELARLMTNKKAREETGCFALEGVRLCADAAAGGVRIHTLLYTESAIKQYQEITGIQNTAEKAMCITEDIAKKISDTKTPQGVFCICSKLDNTESAVKMERSGKYLLLDNLQDPGNLGTVLRTAQALGIDGVLAGSCCDLYSPKVLRSAMGGMFRIPVVLLDDISQGIVQLQQAQIPVYAAALTDDAQPVGQMELSSGCGMLIGNEGNGLSSALIEQCDGAVIIPMREGANSLNAAVAASILIWEMVKHSQVDQ